MEEVGEKGEKGEKGEMGGMGEGRERVIDMSMRTVGCYYYLYSSLLVSPNISLFTAHCSRLGFLLNTVLYIPSSFLPHLGVVVSNNVGHIIPTLTHSGGAAVLTPFRYLKE